ncbi:hypothetical protein M5W75_22835, partial [Paenibacillus larvae]|uniref:hypothetical protein n=1 Tax=Paenibacillus larvae TaxID=1464 RepID=UPI00228137D0
KQLLIRIDQNKKAFKTFLLTIHYFFLLVIATPLLVGLKIRFAHLMVRGFAAVCLRSFVSRCH